jgi:hypothetical protein
MTNVQVFAEAVSDTIGQVILHAVKLGESTSSIRSGGAASVLVSTITLDEACRKHGIKPKFIKIDVEGAEALVMEGTRWILAEYRPTVLLEYHRKFMTPSDDAKNWSIVTRGANSVREVRNARSGSFPQVILEY